MNRHLKKATNILMLIVFTFIVTLGTITFIPVPATKVVAAVTTPTPTPTPTPDLAVYVSGYVFDYITNQKIAGATVLMDTASVTTDANGYYRIGHVFTTRPSSVTLTVSATDYTTAQNISVTVPTSGDANKDVYLMPTVAPTPTWTPTPPPTPTSGWKTATITTGDATNITSTSATVSATATVSGSGQDPDIMLSIDYWETANPSVVMHTDGLFTFYYPTTITKILTGLKPATSYSYRGVSPAGETKTFTTLPEATPTPTPPTTTSTPTPTPTPGGIKVQFFNGNTAATINSIYTNFKLINTGSASVSLANVKMRYYFTNDGTQANSFACDYSTIGSGNVTGSFTTIAKTNADRYLEIGFTSGAGSLAAGASAEVKGRVWKSDWSNFTQTNDYSFNATATTYVDWTKTTGFMSGALSWGIEP